MAYPTCFEDEMHMYKYAGGISALSSDMLHEHDAYLSLGNEHLSNVACAVTLYEFDMRMCGAMKDEV